MPEHANADKELVDIAAADIATAYTSLADIAGIDKTSAHIIASDVTSAYVAAAERARIYETDFEIYDKETFHSELERFRNAANDALVDKIKANKTLAATGSEYRGHLIDFLERKAPSKKIEDDRAGLNSDLDQKAAADVATAQNAAVYKALVNLAPAAYEALEDSNPARADAINKHYREILSKAALDISKAYQDAAYKALADRAPSVGASAQGTDVQGTDVQGTDVQGTDVQGTDVQGTDVQGTDAEQASKEYVCKEAAAPTKAAADKPVDTINKEEIKKSLQEMKATLAVRLIEVQRRINGLEQLKKKRMSFLLTKRS